MGSLHCSRLTMVALLLPFAFNRPALGVPDPWMQPENAEKYLFVGKSVWDIDAGKMVSPTGAPTYISDGHPIVGAPDRIFEPGLNKGLPTMPGIGQIVALDKPDRKQPTLDDKPPQDLGGHNGYWAAPEHRRVVWIQGGDYWRGEVDWKAVKIVNRKQLTTLGVFTPNTPPVLWWGNLLFVSGEFDKAKPIVRINLETGATDEMETYRAFVGRTLSSQVSPSGCRVFFPTASVIYCYDARTGKASMIRNKYEDVPSRRGQQLFVTIPPLWIDDETAYSLDGQGYLARIDLKNSRMDIIQQPDTFVPGSANAVIARQVVLPGGHFVDTSTSTGGGHSEVVQQTARYLLEVATGKRTPLPFDGKTFGTWLDDNIYLYTVTEGGLAKVGTWAYDRTANSTKRLFGKQIDSGRMAYLKKQKQIWAVSQQSGVSLVKLNLDGAGSQDLGPCEMMPPFQFPTGDPIDLGFTGAAADLWKAPAVDEAAIAATQPPEPPAGKIKLFEMIKELPADQQKFAEDAYDYSQTTEMLANYCDPIKVAMKVLEAHKADPQSPALYVTTKFDDCADHDRIARWAHDRALDTLFSEQKLGADQKKAIADKVGACVPDSYFKQSKPELRNMEMLLQQCMNDARGGAPAQSTASSHAPVNQQASGAGTQQPQQNKPATQPAQHNPSQSDVDKAAAKAKKAKDTADKLKGIFPGH